VTTIKMKAGGVDKVTNPVTNGLVPAVGNIGNIISVTASLGNERNCVLTNWRELGGGFG